MKYTLTENSSFPLARVKLGENEQITIEGGSMVYHNGGIKIEGHMNSNGAKGVSGVLKALGRKVTSGEGFFITTATGTTDDGEIAIAPALPGDIKAIEVDGVQQFRLNTGAFLACDPTVTYEMNRQKLSNAILGGTGGLFIMETKGTGQVLVTAYGDLIKIDLDGSRDFVVDNDHVVAWSTSLDYSIDVASGTFGFKTQEGFVDTFKGRGTVYIQSRNLQALADQIDSLILNSKD